VAGRRRHQLPGAHQGARRGVDQQRALHVALIRGSGRTKFGSARRAHGRLAANAGQAFRAAQQHAMLTLRKWLLGSAAIVLATVAGGGGFAWWALQPRIEPLPLPDGLIVVTEPAGAHLLETAQFTLDHAPLSRHFESQRLRSYCGVASSVIVLNALGRRLDQSSFFDTDSADVKPQLAVMISGMTLAEIAAFLSAHDAAVEVHYADAMGIDALRDIVRKNLETADDFILVNYQREALGQRRVGHISPIAAYDDAADAVLILDTAAYNYPPTWVPLARLHEAMATVDAASGRSRGLVEVYNKSPNVPFD
jgi:hypothetical protein